MTDLVPTPHGDGSEPASEETVTAAAVLSTGRVNTPRLGGLQVKSWPGARPAGGGHASARRDSETLFF